MANYADVINQMSVQSVIARTAWGEGRSGGEPLMHGITNTIATRVANPSGWGFNFRGVCLARNQFDCWNEGDPNLPKLLAVTGSDPQFAIALSLACDAVNGTLADIVNGADSYCVIGEEDDWFKGKTPVECIANTAFYIMRKT